MARIYSPETNPDYSWNWTQFTLAGPDAADFLHRLTTVHIRALQPGHGTPGLFLNPQGKIRSSFTLWRDSPDSFIFELDAGKNQKWKQELLAAIDQYTFAERFEIQNASADQKWAWLWLEAGESFSLEPGKTQTEDSLRISAHSPDLWGRPWITLWGSAPQIAAWMEKNFPNAKPALEAEMEAWRIGALSPRADFELTETSQPLDLGLRSAISENKGCYPGQEVVERTVSLGSPARRLSLIVAEDAQSLPEAGTKLFPLTESEREAGVLTSVVKNPTGGWLGLALIKKIFAEEGKELRDSTGTLSRIKRLSSYTL